MVYIILKEYEDDFFIYLEVEELDVDESVCVLCRRNRKLFKVDRGVFMC